MTTWAEEYVTMLDDCEKMAKGKPFAACYWDTPKGRVFSLRSSDDGADVSEVAKQYGGGGHRNASGFTVSFAQAQAFELLTHNVELRGRAAGEGPVERSGTNLSAGLGGADIGDSK